MAKEATALETGLAIIYGTFVKYADSGDGGDPTTINKKELSKMITEQLPLLDEEGMAKTLMKELDEDEDGTMDFMEYCGLITGLSMILHMVISDQLPK
ncbi:hypothetical protein NHX12_023816 [Muraenolepis orangiensis]|uniref:Protein S100 n=1 Tax=Muraenolepis orangiensis TaxID=630683 RepID=A0A9Q0EMY0_9TELE|nr:hypothetical protein NHX12_023816 [Muraenolepis orangiensis]